MFGYGSLLWRPGFDFRCCEKARVYGFHRALRVWSFHHRGTEERPGLVLGLDAGGSCLGCVFEVAESDKQAVAEYLWAREMVTSVYIPRLMTAYPVDGSPPRLTLGFTLDRTHVQYAGPLSATDAARHIAGASGVSGANPEYLRETVGELVRLGMEDHGLCTVLRALEQAERGGRGAREP